MNHCLLEVEVTGAPTIRYTQNNKTPIAEMEVQFDGLRADDMPGTLKVVGWGNLAQDLQNRVQIGNHLLIEGRLRMNTVPRNDGTKEKRAEFTLSRLHPLESAPKGINTAQPQANKSVKSETSSTENKVETPSKTGQAQEEEPLTWNSAPLVPDTDDIPF